MSIEKKSEKRFKEFTKSGNELFAKKLYVEALFDYNKVKFDLFIFRSL